ncbi:MAG TPA: tetratricopeptide repeat-containing diguanylate cyclase [Burkholderiaceae bacterium]|nr:tetratricopeptide repeat-containing diguanylate cyclase [Burkholderiaceae bacterium]
MKRTLGARIAARWLELLLPACLGIVALPATAEPTPSASDAVEGQLRHARDLIGTDADLARGLLARIREQARVAARWDWRLAADEIECRLLADSANDEAQKVAEAGLAVYARAGHPPAAHAAELRLRACRAGTMIEDVDVAAGETELESILAETGPDVAAGHALARLERGVMRSRAGDLVRGQADLLEACESLSMLAMSRDFDLCLGHLANHYRRMGDVDEALRLLSGLLERARERDARIDESVYLFSIAQVHDDNDDWPDALKFYVDAERLSEELRDASGTIYAESGIGSVLVRAGRPSEAMPHLKHALDLLSANSDPIQLLRTRLQMAAAFNALREPRHAAEALAAIDKAVLGSHNDILRAAWLAADADAQAQLGDWEHAYRSLDAWRKVDSALQAQRLSKHAGMLRMKFNRERDAAALRSMQLLNHQAERLRQAQVVALGLFVALLVAALAYAATKVRQARRLRDLATTDELTGLLNRRATLAFLDGALAEGRRAGAALSVMMIDADHFKRINDGHGHAVGDDVLRHLARTLASGLRTQDRIGRFGGEEFLAILPSTSLAEAAAVAERIRELVCRHAAPVGRVALQLTVSIGVAEAAGSRESGSNLIAVADAALYDAKERGRNTVSTTPSSPPAGDADAVPPMTRAPATRGSPPDVTAARAAASPASSSAAAPAT